MQESEYLSLYLHETEQMVDQIEYLLLQEEPSGRMSKESAEELFRLVHTLKGSAAMMGFDTLSETTHRAESVLQELRTGVNAGRYPSSEIWKETFSLAFDLTSYYRDVLEALEHGEDVEENPSIEAAVSSLLSKLQVEWTRSSSETTPRVDDARPKDIERYTRCRVHLQICALPTLRGFLIFRKVQAESESCYTVPADLQTHPELDEQIQSSGFEIGFIPKNGVTSKNILEIIEKQPLLHHLDMVSGSDKATDKPAESRSRAAALVSVRQERVNELIDKMDEMLALEVAIDQRLQEEDLLDASFERLLLMLERRSAEIQGGLMELGMTEIKSLFIRMQRLARDLLSASGKKADVVLIGSELTLDKAVMEAADELMPHVMRNAIDHGLETPQERVAAEKPERGLIEISAQKQNGRFRIAVRDDGRGIDSDKVLGVATKRGLLKKPAEDYSRQEIYNLLLVSGFTTTTEVTQSSGRGVGLDAVQHMVQKMGGQLHILSEPGQGSEFVFDLPVSLTTLDALFVQAGNEEFYVPVSVVERVVGRKDVTLREDATLQFGDAAYLPLLSDMASDGDVMVLLALDKGAYYIRCRRIVEYGEYLAKPLPSVLKRILGDGNVYSGCVQNHLGGLNMILDVEKLT